MRAALSDASTWNLLASCCFAIACGSPAACLRFSSVTNRTDRSDNQGVRVMPYKFPIPEDFGADGTGSRDTTAEFLAMQNSTLVCMAKPGSRYAVQGLKFKNGFKWINHSAGGEYTGPPPDYISGSFIRPPGVPTSQAILDLNHQADSSYGRALVFEGLAIDGIDGTMDGISGGSEELTLIRPFITRCRNGLGGATPLAGGGHASAYTRSATIELPRVFNCSSAGLRDFIDSKIIHPVLANNLVGFQLMDGCNFVLVDGGRIEWNTNENVRLSAAQNPIVKFTIQGTQLDRGGMCSIYAKLCQFLTINGIQVHRAAAQGSTLVGQCSQIFLQDCTEVAIGGAFMSQHGQNDPGDPSGNTGHLARLFDGEAAGRFRA
jgi:hypothetical protein